MARNGFGHMADMEDKKEDVMRLVEAQIVANVDLTPDEMVDAAVMMVDKINEKIYH